MMTPDDAFTPEHYPLVDTIDHEILMHRDAHFGGQFSIMLDYYRQEKRGIQPEFDLSRLERLATLEDQLKQNLAALFLASHEMQQVADARAMYQQLKAIYEVKSPKTRYPQLIADLILTEDEEATAEIAAVIAEKDKIVPALIEILRNEQLYDPLFPGYGLTPFLAVQCLGQIGDKRAIISLFEALGEGDFFADEQIIVALKAIGTPARDFLLHVVKALPLNEDNERAVIALIAFKEDEEVANFCLTLLQQAAIQKDFCLSTYLILVCAGLKDPAKRQLFKEMALDSHFSPFLHQDMQVIVHDWEEEKVKD